MRPKSPNGFGDDGESPHGAYTRNQGRSSNTRSTCPNSGAVVDVDDSDRSSNDEPVVDEGTCFCGAHLRRRGDQPWYVSPARTTDPSL